MSFNPLKFFSYWFQDSDTTKAPNSPTPTLTDTPPIQPEQAMLLLCSHLYFENQANKAIWREDLYVFLVLLVDTLYEQPETHDLALHLEERFRIPDDSHAMSGAWKRVSRAKFDEHLVDIETISSCYHFNDRGIEIVTRIKGNKLDSERFSSDTRRLFTEQAVARIIETARKYRSKSPDQLGIYIQDRFPSTRTFVSEASL